MSPSARPIFVELAPPPAANPAKNSAADDEHKRLVQSNQGREVQEAAPNSYLGEKTRVVDRQTVNTHHAVQMGKAGNPARAQTPPKDQLQAARSQPKPKGETQAENKPEIAKLGLPILPDARRKGAMEDAAKDEPQWANIGSEAQDYVEGIKQADRTALNTREYKFFGYHQRIRQRLELEWTRLLRAELIRFYRSGRQLASETEYTTRLMVILNDRGEITRIKILSVSGTQELDDVAVNAFNRAGPFPNPPKGLVRNGEIEVPWEMKLRS